MGGPVALPDLARQRALAGGTAGRRWLDELPDRLQRLCRAWGLTPGEVLPGGTASCTLAATDGDGQPCVLKVAMPLGGDDDEEFDRSVRTHRLADGRGCAELLAVDHGERAMLLERLGPNLHDLGLDVQQRQEAIAATLLAFWRPVDDPAGLQAGTGKARWLAGFVEVTWRRLGEPCDGAAIDRVRELCRRRASAFDPRRAVLGHGDAHGWNALDAGDGTYRFVDPEGLWTEPEHDLAVPMREDNDALLAGDTPTLVRRRAGELAVRCGVDADAVDEWGFIERVSTGLTALASFDDPAVGRGFLTVAERCL